MTALLFPDIGYGGPDDTLLDRAIAAVDQLRAEDFDVVAGYGLGEVAAWYAAGGVDAELARKVAGLRQAAVKKAPRGGLMALPGDALPPMTVETAAWNSADEIVVSGLDADLAGLGGEWVHRGTPWYSWHLDAVVPPLLKKLQRLASKPIEIEMVASRDGQTIDNPGAVARHIAEQISRPIQWDRTVRNLYYQRGVRRFVFVGTEAGAARLVHPNVPQADVVAFS